MTPLQKIRRIFPGVLVETEGESIVVDLLFRFEPGTFHRKTIRGFKEMDGFVLIKDTGEDVLELGRGPLDEMIKIAVVEYALFRAIRELDEISIEEQVAELRCEGVII